MEVDSKGNLYVADTCGDRIHKFERSYFDIDNNFVMGDYVGWMGKCESSTNKACDTDTQVSKGFSCTDAEGENTTPGDLTALRHPVIRCPFRSTPMRGWIAGKVWST